MCDGRRRQEPRQRINCLIESKGNNMNNNIKQRQVELCVCLCLCLLDWQSKLGLNTQSGGHHISVAS